MRRTQRLGAVDRRISITPRFGNRLARVPFERKVGALAEEHLALLRAAVVDPAKRLAIIRQMQLLEEAARYTAGVRS